MVSGRSLIPIVVLTILVGAGWNPASDTPPTAKKPSHTASQAAARRLDPRCANLRQAATAVFISLTHDAILARDECVTTLGAEFCKDQIAKVIVLQKMAHEELAKSDSVLCAEKIARENREEAERKAQGARDAAELKKQCLALRDRLQAEQAWKSCVHGKSWPTMAELEAQCGKQPTPSSDDSDLYERCALVDSDRGVEGGVDGGVEGGVVGGVVGGVDGGMNDQPLYAGIGGVSNPKLIASSKVSPKYPEEARKAKVTGQVVLQVVIHKDGTVGDAIVLKSPGAKFGFDEAAIAAVKQWKYKPGQQNGKPVDVYFTVVVDVDEDPSARPDRP